MTPPSRKLSEVCDIIAGQHVASDLYDRAGEGSPYLTGPADFGERYPVITKWTRSPKVFATSADVLVTVKGAGVGKSNLGTNAAIGRQLMALRPKNGLLDQSFLFAFIRSQEAKLNAAAQGATVPGIGKDTLESIEIPLPSPSEQRRIADILDEADALRRKRAEAIRLANDLVPSVFCEMFGDPVGNAKKWPVERFSDVCDSRLGKMLDAGQQTGLHRKPYMRNFNIQWGRLDLSSISEMDFAEHERDEFRLRYGDVLICEGGAGVGQTASWRDELPECYYQKSLHRVRPKPNKATPQYIVSLMWFLIRAGGILGSISTATIPHLTGEKLKSIRIPVPPIDLQSDFEEAAHDIMSVQNAQLSSNSELDNLFNALLQRAFRGEL